MSTKSVYQPKYANSWAMVIGIDKYQNVPPLGCARKDAQGIATVLIERFHFPKDNVTLLLDQDATRQAICKDFHDYRIKSKDDDRLLFFFAGHGASIQGKRSDAGFLIPVDGINDRLDTFIRWDELTKNAELIPAKHIFFLMDACYGGLALKRKIPSGSMRFLRDMAKRYARQVIASGKEDEVVADSGGPRAGHSIFTGHVLDGMDGAAANDGIITANSLMAYAYHQVGNDHNSEQTPQYGLLDGDGDFIFDPTPLDELQTDEKEAKDVLIHVSATTEESDEQPSISGQVKKFLSDPSLRIEFDDFISKLVRGFIERTSPKAMPPRPGTVKKEEFIERLKTYEELSSDLQTTAILLGRWAVGDQLDLLEKLITRTAEAPKESKGTSEWLRLQWYPIWLLMYSAGIAALYSKKYEALPRILTPKIQFPFGNQLGDPILIPVIDQMKDLHNYFALVPGHEKNFTPRSEYTYKTLQPAIEDLLFPGQRYENLFDEFEILFALVYVDLDPGQRVSVWAPPSRFMWKHRHRKAEGSPFVEVVSRAEKMGDNWALLKTGLFEGSKARFVSAVDGLNQFIGRLPWF